MALTKVHNRMVKGSIANVLDFGAAGDNVADDSVAVQAAINSGAGRVYFPPGTYKLNQQITWSGVDLVGEGKLTFINCQFSGINFFVNNSTERCSIIDIFFSGTGTNKCFSAGVGSAGWRHVSIKSCSFAVFDTAIEVNDSLFFYAENCEFDRCQGIIFDGTYNNCAVINCCYFDGAGAHTYGIHFNMPTTSNGNNITLMGCAFDDYNTGCSIRYGRASFINCYFEDNTAKHIQGDNADIIVDGGFMKGQSGTGTANAYNLENTRLREILEPRFLDNFAFIYSIQANSRVYTPNGYNAPDVQLITGGTYYTDVFSKGTNPAVFEEGVFTPAFEDDDSPQNTYSGTYSATPTGTYVRNGNMVFISINISANQGLVANGLTGAQQLLISGLPFVADSAVSSALAIDITSQINLSSGYTQMLSFVPANKGYIQLREVGDNVAAQNLTVTQCDNTGASFKISGTYYI